MKRFTHIVMTSGISALSPHNAYAALARQGELLGMERGSIRPPDGVTEPQALEAWRKATQHSSAMHKDPRRVSAEYSLVHALHREGRLAGRPRIVLLHTDTLGGRACAELLLRLVERDFSASTSLRELADVDGSDRPRLRRSLGAFMGQVAQALDGCDPSFTCFAPIGGDKALTSLGYLAGAWRGFPTVCLHEDGQTLSEIPPVPLGIPRRTLAGLAPTMLRVGDAVSGESLTLGDRGAVKAHPWLFEEVDGFVALNALGHFLMRLPEHAGLFHPRVRVSPQVEALGQMADQRAFLCQQLRELTQKLELGAGELHREWFEGGDWSLYQGASDGKLVFRAAWQLRGQELQIGHVWVNHDRYERDAEQHVAALDSPDPGWADWTEAVHG